MKKNYIVGMVSFLIVWFPYFQTNAVAEKSDILFVLDNSGSMKPKDPDFLARKVVTDLVKRISKDSQVGFVIFSDKAELALSLTVLEDSEFDKKETNALTGLTYRGKYTNIPSAMERAVYELKTNGRKDTQKLIVFMTDGFIDTGNRKKDEDLEKWLRDELIQETRNANIRIHSVAFSEEADFALIQTLALKTDGAYYRAITESDLQGVFNTILTAINTPRPEKQVPTFVKETPPEKNIPQSLPKPDEKKEIFSNSMPTIAIAVLFIIGIIVIIIISNKKKRKSSDKSPEPIESSEPISSVEEAQPVLPMAILEDIESVTGKKEFCLSKKEITIGRALEVGESSVDITISQSTVSALHAAIEYRDNGFYIIDRRSTNKTFLNKKILSPDVAHRLKSGDIITFDKYCFRFIIKEQTGRSGTVLRPATAGGTVLRPPGTPEQRPQQPEPDAVSLEETLFKDDEEGTQIKPKRCEIHPSFKATEYCPGCKKGYCKQCMVEKDGKWICQTCAAS